MGVLSPRLFAMMVLMAIATTMGTTPVLRLLHPQALTGLAVGLDPSRRATAS